MSDSLKEILQKRGSGEPDNFKVIKKYVQEVIGEVPRLKILDKSVIIYTTSSGAAGALRPHIHKLESQIGNKRLIIQIKK